MLNPLFTDYATQPQNLLHVNFVPDNLGYIASWIAKRARLVRVRELGPGAATVNVVLPVATPTSVLLPASACYMQWSTAGGGKHIPIAFGSCLAPRMLVAQDIHSMSFFSAVCQSYLPDIVALDAKIELPAEWYSQYQLTPVLDVATDTEIKEWGVHGVGFWTNELGKESLRHSLAMFDSYYHRRRMEQARVYDVGELILCEGFYPVESDNGNQWAWTGSETLATFLVPSHGNGRLKITLFLFGTKIDVNQINIQIFVDGNACSCEFVMHEKIEIVTGYVASGSSHRVDIFQSRTMLTGDGSRQIGFALHKVKVEAVS